jgi:hypothetical protein
MEKEIPFKRSKIVLATLGMLIMCAIFGWGLFSVEPGRYYGFGPISGNITPDGVLWLRVFTVVLLAGMFCFVLLGTIFVVRGVGIRLRNNVIEDGTYFIKSTIRWSDIDSVSLQRVRWERVDLHLKNGKKHAINCSPLILTTRELGELIKSGHEERSG